MKRAILLLILVVTASFLLLWTYVQSDSFSLRIRPYVVGPLQSALGPGANVGWVKANLLPLYVEIRDVSVPVEGRADALAVRKIKAYLNPFPLLWKKISIPSVSVLEPRAFITRSADGRVDIVEFAKKLASSSTGTAAQMPFSVDIRTVTVSDGTISFADEGTPANIRVSRLNIRGRLWLQEATVDIRSAKADLTVSLPDRGKYEAALDAAIVWRKSTLLVRRLAMTAPFAELRASGEIGLDRDAKLAMRITGRLGERKAGPLRKLLKGKSEGRGPSVEMDVTVSGRAANPIVDGSVDLQRIAAGRLSLANAHLGLSYREGTATVRGDELKIVPRGRVPVSSRFEIVAQYVKGEIEVTKARLSTADLDVAAEGRLGPDTGYDLSVKGASTGKGASLSALAGIDIAGEINVSGIVSGGLRSPRVSGTLSGGPFSVRGVPFESISGEVLFENGTLSVVRSSIVEGRSRYILDSTVKLGGEATEFHATLEAERSDVGSIVALFYKKLPLDITASGLLSFSGSVTAYSGSAHLELEKGSAYGESFDGGSLAVELTRDQVSFPAVTLKKGKGQLTGSGWIGFKGNYDAKIEGKGLDLQQIDRKGTVPLSGPLVFHIQSSGPFSAPFVKAHAESPALSYGGLSLGDTICDLTLAEGKVGLTASVRGEQGEAIGFRGSMALKAPYSWSLMSTVHFADRELPSAGGAGDIVGRIRLSADASLELSGSGGNPSALNGVLLVPQLSVTLGEYVVQNDGNTKIRCKAGTLHVESLVLTGLGTHISVNGSSGLGQDLSLAVSGNANLSLLRLLTRAIEHGDGFAVANISLRGSWAEPDITGEATVQNGLLKIRDFPQRFTGISGTVKFDRDRIATENLHGEFGGGTISVAGTAQLKNLKLVDFSSKVKIENITVRYPVGFTATLGGELYYDGDASQQMLSGEVGIRRARYERRVEWKSMLVDFTRGFTPKKKIDVGWIGETQLNVRFFGSENILFENNLAKIPLSMDMIIRGTVNQPQVLGHIEARKGEVYFRRNVFRILHASADFADPNKINPSLDVQAETSVREYRIVLSVTGHADRAVVTFASDPPLTDANILALLTIGRKTEDIAGKEAEVGGGEAVSFATGKVQDIIESRARSLTGLDRFQVDPYFSKSDVAVPRVTAGKELVKDKLFVTYSSNVGAATPEQMFSIEYIVNRNVSLVGERNDIGNIGADIKFHFSFR